MGIAQDGEGKKQKPEKLLRRRRSEPPQRVRSKKVVVSCDERMPKCEKRKRSTVDGPFSVVNTHVMDRAKEVQSCLQQEFPSLVKPMVKSHVAGGFWLGLPKGFCTLHLPEDDAKIILEDESGKEHETKYLAYKSGLSGGWRGFSIAHSLVEGDVLVFHLVEPTRFKVYIVRSRSFGEVDGALGLLGLDPCLKTMSSGTCFFLRNLTPSCFLLVLQFVSSILVMKSAENDKKTCEEIEDDEYWEPLAYEIPLENGEDNEDPVPELLDGIRFSQSVIDFKDVRSIEDFTIVVDRLVIDSEFSKNLRAKYYDLCCSQRSFLHEKLLEGLNCKLAAGIISETMNIADAIRASRITTSPEYFAVWEKTLKAFADLGMEVGFLQARLELLTNLVGSKRIKIARSEQASAEEEVSRLEAKIMEAKETISKLDAEIKTLEKNKNGLELMFHDLAMAPW
ncbi:B3 domain-containing protein Os01g0234100-like isoform X1 [Punica granatum]|uniref:B3 domain-containing protein Os01g0234100-like isoform X1 n=1 Tax=Punica granatum TaxID=22663 RepID=A0A6P8D770_PUNGR|nr:B3 domain-containing protein Os01g0234100-like isoform X1 [Punica granatum]